jgi:RHS repeat-associated protein
MTIMAARTIILATNHHQSPLQLLTGEGATAMAFSPYGYNALGVVAGTPRFNGERLDPVTGHYPLGNGYRTYNPVLGRFNSPDTLSPFGPGGLNAYSYCVGDPVNRTDPSGHIAIGKPLGRLFVPRAPKVAGAKPPKVLTQFDKIGEGAMIFTDTYKGKPRLNVFAHGEYDKQRGMGIIMIDGQARDPMWLAETLEERGIDFSTFSNARIVACHSANEGDVSFASYFSRYSGLPAKGYEGINSNKTYWHKIRDEIRIGAQPGMTAISHIPFVEKFKNLRKKEDYGVDINFKPVKFRPN